MSDDVCVFTSVARTRRKVAENNDFYREVTKNCLSEEITLKNYLGETQTVADTGINGQHADLLAIDQ